MFPKSKLSVIHCILPNLPRRVNVAEIVANANEPSIQESKDFIEALTCRKCRRNIVSNASIVAYCEIF